MTATTLRGRWQQGRRSACVTRDVRRALLPLLIAASVSGCGPLPAASSSPAPTYSATVLADGPVAYWRMHETTGIVMTDATRHRTNGTYVGGFTLGEPGAMAGAGNAAVAFDGVSGGARVEGASLQLDTVTIEFWAKKRAESESGFYVSKNFLPYGGVGSGWFQLLNHGHSGRLEFRVTGDGGPALVSSTVLALNRWYYVVATYDGLTARLFVDGILDSTLDVTAVPKQAAVPLYLGRRSDGFGNDAVLDEVAIYPVALTADTIARHWRLASSTP